MLSKILSPVLAAAILVTGLSAASCEKDSEQSQPIAEPSAIVESAELVSTAADEPAKSAAQSVGPGEGMAAIESTAEAEKYLFAFFYRDNEDEQTRKMREVFDGAMKSIADRAEHIAINVGDPAEKEIVDRFNVSRAPMPIVLAVAPNGAITGGFPTAFDEKQIVEAVATPSMQKCLKALQERKLVLLCVQNGTTRLNDEAMEGVRAFKADPRYGRQTEIVTLNPADAAEAKALKNLQVDPKTDEAITVLLAPPGSALAKFKGKTDKNMLVATLNQANSGCGPGGCGPGGCGPKKK